MRLAAKKPQQQKKFDNTKPRPPKTDVAKPESTEQRPYKKPYEKKDYD